MMKKSIKQFQEKAINNSFTVKGGVYGDNSGTTVKGKKIDLNP